MSIPQSILDACLATQSGHQVGSLSQKLGLRCGLGQNCSRKSSRKKTQKPGEGRKIKIRVKGLRKNFNTIYTAIISNYCSRNTLQFLFLPSSGVAGPSRCNRGSESSVLKDTARPAWPHRAVCSLTPVDLST